MMGSAAAALILLSSAPALGTQGLPRGWEPLTFERVREHTGYSWSREERAVHARSEASASGLVFRLDSDPGGLPVLRWRWKVSGVLPAGDAHRKSGDDYAARVYVLFRYEPEKAGFLERVKYGLARKLHGEYPPHSVINYIWANRLPRGESVPNAYTGRARMVAVRSGDGKAGRWVSEQRDVVGDYRRLFGEDPPPLAGIAVMTDSDDTGGSAEAWYADIALCREEDPRW